MLAQAANFSCTIYLLIDIYVGIEISINKLYRKKTTFDEQQKMKFNKM